MGDFDAAFAEFQKEPEPAAGPLVSVLAAVARPIPFRLAAQGPNGVMAEAELVLVPTGIVLDATGVAGMTYAVGYGAGQDFEALALFRMCLHGDTDQSGRECVESTVMIPEGDGQALASSHTKVPVRLVLPAEQDIDVRRMEPACSDPAGWAKDHWPDVLLGLAQSGPVGEDEKPGPFMAQRMFVGLQPENAEERHVVGVAAEGLTHAEAFASGQYIPLAAVRTMAKAKAVAVRYGVDDPAIVRPRQ